MKEFRFAQAENGGWVVFGVADSSVPTPIIAAFSSTEDLIAGFAELLNPSEGSGSGDVELGEGDV
ncbi:hypothetical protein [Rhizobium sp. 21-4511-3d]